MKKMTKAERDKLYKQIDEKTKVLSIPTSVHETISYWINGFPKELANLWRVDCRKNYNDIYWAKIWSDHLKAQAYDNLISNGDEQTEQSAEEEKENKEEEIPLIGDGGK